MQTIAKALKKPITSTILAILFGFIVAIIVLACAGYSPFEAMYSLFHGMLGSPKYISNVIIKSVPLIMTGIAIAFAFKAGLFNIGAEGQYIAGSIAAVIVGTSFNFPPVIQIPLVLIAGMIAGAIFGAITGFLKAKFGIHEVITSIMLNWIALYLCNYISNSSIFSMPESTSTNPVNPSSYIMLLPDWKVSDQGMEALKQHPFLSSIMSTDVNFGIFIAIAVAIIISFLLYHTTKGYEYRAVGLSKDAAEFAGINVNRSIVQTMLISGAICGLGAALIICGTYPHSISTLGVFENNGFNGIAVALIAGASPIGCIFSGLLFGGLLYGGQAVQFDTGAPTDIVNIMIGTIIFFVALTKVVPVIAAKLEKRGAKHDK